MRSVSFRTAIPLATASLVLAGIGLAAHSVADMPNTTEGELVRYLPVAPNTEVLPVGAWARVRAIETSSGKTVVTLQVRGLAANATYGAHAHYKACGSSGAAAGAHYQNSVDPAVLIAAAAATPPRDPETIASTDANYANATNEVWLDLATDDEGNGSAQTVVDWQFRGTDPVQRSLIIHRDFTDPHDGSAGVAGPRLGCLSVAF
jgi:Cu-Zn family superoxide dismutase